MHCRMLPSLHHMYMQVTLSEDMQPRDLHTATAFSLAPGLTEVAMFGGSPKRVPGQPRIAETTVLQFGESSNCCCLCQ